MIQGILQSLIATIIVTLVQWLYNKYKNNKHKLNELPFLKKYFIYAITFQIISLISEIIAIFLYYDNKVIFWCVHIVSSICAGQSIIRWYCLYKFAQSLDNILNKTEKSFENIEKNFQEICDKIPKKSTNK